MTHATAQTQLAVAPINGLTHMATSYSRTNLDIGRNTEGCIYKCEHNWSMLLLLQLPLLLLLLLSTSSQCLLCSEDDKKP
jgi:hypothetical protein